MTRQLNKNKLNHRIFAQFMVEDDDSSEQNEPNEPQTAATKPGDGVSEDGSSRITNVDLGYSGNSVLIVPHSPL